MKCKAEGRKIVYKLKDPVLVYELLITHENKFSDDGITKDVLRLCEFFFPKKKIRLIGDTKKGEEEFLEVIYDIFPHPYYG